MSNVTAFDDGASSAQAAGAQMLGMQNSDAQAPGVHASSERADGAQMPGAQASEAQEASAQAADRENLTWQGFGDACRQIGSS